jgi:hypothetical protein
MKFSYNYIFYLKHLKVFMAIIHFLVKLNGIQ